MLIEVNMCNQVAKPVPSESSVNSIKVPLSISPMYLHDNHKVILSLPPVHCTAHRMIGKKMPTRKRTLPTKYNMLEVSHRVLKKISTILYCICTM